MGLLQKVMDGWRPSRAGARQDPMSETLASFADTKALRLGQRAFRPPRRNLAWPNTCHSQVVICCCQGPAESCYRAALTLIVLPILGSPLMWPSGLLMNCAKSVLARPVP